MAHSSGFPPPELNAVLSEVTELLKARGESVSVAESAAGGLISASLLSQPGASSIFYGGLTLYTLLTRVKYAGWTQDTIRSSYECPSTDIAEWMAQAVRKDLKSTYTVAESGTAGPTGSKIRKTNPGDLAIAIDSDRGTISRELNTGLGGDRIGNMVRFAVEALTLLREAIEQNARNDGSSGDQD